MAEDSGSDNAPMNSAPATSKPAAANSVPPESLTGSPRSRRGTRPVSSPWTQVIRVESEVIAAAPSVTESAGPVAAMSSASSTSSGAEEESLENGGSGRTGKKPVWNKPSNRSSSPELIDVMGAESWPALSEAARAPSKSSSDSLKGFSEGSSSILPAPQATQTASSNSLNLKQGIDNANPNSTPSQPTASRPRPAKRNGPNVSSNGTTSQLTGVQIPAGEAYLNNTSTRDHNQRSSQSRGSNDHTQQPRHSYRNRGGGRGESSQHHNYGGRRDHDRTNQDLNGRNFNGREAHLQPQRGYIGSPPPPPPLPAPASGPFMVPNSVGLPGHLLPYHPDYGMFPFYRLPPPPLDPLRMPHFMAPLPPAFPSPEDPELHPKIIKQIDYYFSNENLVKDTFLRQNMDDHGWVPIELIAGFKKVLDLTENVQLILEVLRSSIVVEVQGEKLRRRDDWARWIMPPAIRFPNAAAAAAGNSSHNVLVDRVQSMGLERTLGHGSASGESESHTGVFPHPSSSGDLTTQSQPPINEETSLPSDPASDDHHSTSGRSSS